MIKPINMESDDESWCQDVPSHLQVLQLLVLSPHPSKWSRCVGASVAGSAPTDSGLPGDGRLPGGAGSIYLMAPGISWLVTGHCWILFPDHSLRQKNSRYSSIVVGVALVESIFSGLIVPGWKKSAPDPFQFQSLQPQENPILFRTYFAEETTPFFFPIG